MCVDTSGSESIQEWDLEEPVSSSLWVEAGSGNVRLRGMEMSYSEVNMYVLGECQGEGLEYFGPSVSLKSAIESNYSHFTSASSALPRTFKYRSEIEASLQAPDQPLKS